MDLVVQGLYDILSTLPGLTVVCELAVCDERSSMQCTQRYIRPPEACVKKCLMSWETHPYKKRCVLVYELRTMSSGK